MKMTFLGTGTSQGVPVIGCNCPVCRSADVRDKRLRASALLETEGKVLLVDAGPDFRQQLLRERVRQLDGILLTHEHKDHIAGLDDVRAFNHITGKPVDVYAEQRVLKALKREFRYVFSKTKYPGAPEMTLHVIGENRFRAADVPVTPIRLWHHRLPVLGFRIDNLAYITDVNKVEHEEFAKLKHLEALVVGTVRRGKHVSHFSLEEALAFIAKVNPRTAYLTHLSHQFETHAELQASLPAGVQVAYDGLEIKL
ncbi:MAG: MBL fold metallo-hydrolase [Prevotellaceae bacterium]|nr:MBL fold metallo-hydrolase [Prevotellaceae bacterium]